MPGKDTPSTDAPSAVGSQIDERLDHLEALVTALSAEIELLRAERKEWRASQPDAQAADDEPARPSREELRAVGNGEHTDAAPARVAALELVAAGLDRETVAAELQRLGMDDPEPVVDEVFRDEQQARRAS
jgi:outer membrane murein-binding lipoprotein Lpp